MQTAPTLISLLALLAALAGCIPPPGFARTPTPALPTLSPEDVCADYISDANRAIHDFQMSISAQLTDLTAIGASGRSPAETVALRVSDRRDELFRNIAIYERPAPCGQAQNLQTRLTAAAPGIRSATALLKDASDNPSPTAYMAAIEPYRQALLALAAAR